MLYTEATWHPSPNFSQRRQPVALIVIHITDGQPDVERAVESHQDPEKDKSAHFFIGRAGEIFQLIDTNDAAWHDKGRNQESIGIEHVARTPGEFKNWGELSERMRRKLVPEGAAIDSNTDPGMPLTEAQLAASACLVARLIKDYSLAIDAVVPHCSNPNTGHKDCGRDVNDGGIWPWTDYRRRINEALANLAD